MLQRKGRWLLVVFLLGMSVLSAMEQVPKKKKKKHLYTTAVISQSQTASLPNICLPLKGEHQRLPDEKPFMIIQSFTDWDKATAQPMLSFLQEIGPGFEQKTNVLVLTGSIKQDEVDAVLEKIKSFIVMHEECYLKADVILIEHDWRDRAGLTKLVDKLGQDFDVTYHRILPHRIKKVLPTLLQRLYADYELPYKSEIAIKSRYELDPLFSEKEEVFIGLVLLSAVCSSFAACIPQNDVVRYAIIVLPLSLYIYYCYAVRRDLVKQYTPKAQ